MEPTPDEKEKFIQKVHFASAKSECSVEIIAQDVMINSYPDIQRDGSSTVKLTNIVDYQWEYKYYKGQLNAVHINGKVIAYGIKGKDSGMIRIVNPETNQRALIKDLKGLVQDISFALTASQIVLGFVDEEGNLYVYNIHDKPQAITYEMILHVVHPVSVFNPKTNYRVIWCPYVPCVEEDADVSDDLSKMLVFLNGKSAEIWDVDVVSNNYGIGPIEANQKYDGFIEIDDHVLDVVDASLSPDGTAIATACLDGYVKFFQVYLYNTDKPKCLHQWQPHDGKPLSSMFFLDNISNYNSESKFWKFAITGANNNAELKIWSCESWTCLQKIHFTPNPKSLSADFILKARLDMTANYLILSDINNKALYVLQIQKNDSERQASISHVTELHLPAPFLSFCISNATIGTLLRHDSNPDDMYGIDDYECECENIQAVQIKMYVVQPKSLQACNITFQTSSIKYNQNDNVGGYINNESDEEVKIKNEIANLDDLHNSVSLLIQQQQQMNAAPPLNLMSPADFASPVISPNKPVNSPPVKGESNVDNLIDFQQPQKDNFASGGSSPSREVQEILSLKNPQEYFDKLTKDESDSTEILQPSNFNHSDIPSKETIWPTVPKIDQVESFVLPETEAQPYTLPDSEDTQDGAHSDPNNTTITASDYNVLNYKIASLENMVKEQNNLIRSLVHELKSSSSNSDSSENLKKNVNLEFDLAMKHHQTQIAKMFDQYLKEQIRKDRELSEHLTHNITQNLTKRLAEHVQNAVSHEIKSCIHPIISSEIKNIVLPAVLAIFEKLHIQLEMHYSQKLNSLDQLLKTNINKLATNKAVTDSLSSNVINVVKPSLEQCYKDMISTTLIPSWERVCNTMFQQIHNTFTQGTKEYTSSVESYMDRQRKVQDKGKDLISQMTAVSDSMKANAEKLNTSLASEIQRQVHASFASLQDNLMASVTDSIREQVKNGFKAQAAILEDSVANAVRSRAVTPSPHAIDSQIYTQLDHLIASHNYEAAFQQALSASSSVHDVRFVLHVCDQVNPQEVFGVQGKSGCILPQNVLLSLIQQLSTDLSRKTEIKLRYLQEATLSLEADNSLTKQHMPVVLTSLSNNIKQFTIANPNHKCVKAMRILQLATRSLLN